MNAQGLRAIAALLASIVFLGLAILCAPLVILMTMHLLATFPVSELSLGLLSLVVSLVTLLITVVWNLVTYRLTRDLYQPGFEVEWIKVPRFYDGSGNELTFGLRNNGQRNLDLKRISISGNWFSRSIPCESEDNFVAPGELCTFSVKLPMPKPDRKCRVTLTVDDAAGRFRWIRHHSFRAATSQGVHVTEAQDADLDHSAKDKHPRD